MVAQDPLLHGVCHKREQKVRLKKHIWKPTTCSKPSSHLETMLIAVII